jgi:hypothetical protein
VGKDARATPSYLSFHPPVRPPPSFPSCVLWRGGSRQPAHGHWQDVKRCVAAIGRRCVRWTWWSEAPTSLPHLLPWSHLRAHRDSLLALKFLPPVFLSPGTGIFPLGVCYLFLHWQALWNFSTGAGPLNFAGHLLILLPPPPQNHFSSFERVRRQEEEEERWWAGVWACMGWNGTGRGERRGWGGLRCGARWGFVVENGEGGGCWHLFLLSRSLPRPLPLRRTPRARRRCTTVRR